jgi:hypothetical protein
MVISPSTVYAGNDSVFRVVGLSDSDGNYHNDAAVTVQGIRDASTSEAVVDNRFPITLDYIVQSDGLYEGILPYDLGLVSGKDYLATVRAVSASGLRAEWEERLRVRVRKG